MASLTEQLTSQAQPPWQAHPLYRFWKKLLDSPNVARLSVSIHRPREGLSYAPAKMYVTTVLKDETQREPGEYAWDPVANQALVHLKARCSERGDEIMRFALMAEHCFLPIEERYGDGYFNSVFLEVVRSLDNQAVPQLSATLKQVAREYKAAEGQVHDGCFERIMNVIAGLSADLVASGQLGYPHPEADAILDGALAQYVDERFSVTNRKMLGW